MFGTTWGTGQVVLLMLWFAFFFIEIWLLISVLTDIFRNHDLPGWRKAVWVMLVIVLPLVGILAYLVVHGGQMRAHSVEAQRKAEAMFGNHRQPTPVSHCVDELSRLADLKAAGIIDDAEYRRLRAQVPVP